MKRISVLFLVLFLTSCRSGDLITYYSSSGMQTETAGQTISETEGEETEEEETEAPKLPIGSLVLMELSDTVQAGKTASVKVKGLPNTEYSIVVTYTSVSTANGLESKLSNGEGIVSWSWRVGNQTKPGKYRIEIQSKAEKMTLYFTVTEK